MAEQTMTTGQRIRELVDKLDVSEIIFELTKRIGEDRFTYMANPTEGYVLCMIRDKDSMEKAVNLLNDLKVNKLVSFEIIENANEILVSPDIKKYR